jgi:glycosyltransferase involved in cell wall biosynthesis
LLDSLHVASVSVNDALFERPLGDDLDVVQALAERVGRLSLVVATPRPRAQLRLSENLTLIPAPAPSRPKGLTAIVRELSRLNREARLGVIQAQEPFYTGLAALVAARRSGAPLVVAVLGADPDDPGFRGSGIRHRVASVPGRAVLKRATVVQTDTHVIVDRLARRGLPARYKPITPLNLRDFLDVGEQRVQRTRPASVLFVGRLGPQKRVGLVLEGFQRLRALVPEARLTLVGSGPEEAALRAHAARLGLGECVTFRGMVPQPELPGIYGQADLLLLASRYEGMPRVFLEAAATGLPIVSTPVAGALELASRAPVGIADPSPDGLATAASRMLDDHDLRTRAGEELRNAMRERAREPAPYLQQLDIWKEVAR